MSRWLSVADVTRAYKELRVLRTARVAGPVVVAQVEVELRCAHSPGAPLARWQRCTECCQLGIRHEKTRPAKGVVA